MLAIFRYLAVTRKKGITKMEINQIDNPLLCILRDNHKWNRTWGSKTKKQITSKLEERQTGKES